MDFSISQYRDQFETSPTSDKENYVVKIHENYVVRVPESLVRRLEENKRRDAERGGRVVICVGGLAGERDGDTLVYKHGQEGLQVKRKGVTIEKTILTDMN